MPKIQIEARLIQITKPLARGEWMMLNEDDSYTVVPHAEAMAMQGRQTRRRLSGAARLNQLDARREKATEPASTPQPTQKGAIQPRHFIVVHGKKVYIQRKVLEALEAVAELGPMTVAEAPFTSPGSCLSTGKTMGFLSAEPVGNSLRNGFRYSLTNEGRAIVAAHQGKQLPGTGISPGE